MTTLFYTLLTEAQVKRVAACAAAADANDFDLAREVLLAEDPETDLDLYRPDPAEVREIGPGSYQARRHRIE